jgi:NADH:ubiquinone oxidoreductase subunit 2 (subunit N)
VIAFFYYSGIIRQMWFREPADGGGRVQTTLPPALGAAIVLTSATVLAVGVYPEIFARVGDLATRFVS